MKLEKEEDYELIHFEDDDNGNKMFFVNEGNCIGLQIEEDTFMEHISFDLKKKHIPTVKKLLMQLEELEDDEE